MVEAIDVHVDRHVRLDKRKVLGVLAATVAFGLLGGWGVIRPAGNGPAVLEAAGPVAAWVIVIFCGCGALFLLWLVARPAGILFSFTHQGLRAGRGAQMPWRYVTKVDERRKGSLTKLVVLTVEPDGRPPYTTMISAALAEISHQQLLELVRVYASTWGAGQRALFGSPNSNPSSRLARQS